MEKTAKKMIVSENFESSSSMGTGACINQTSRRSSDAKAVPNYLRASTSSCHHVCKYGGKHTFEDKETHKTQQRPRKQLPVVADKEHPQAKNQKRTMIKIRSLSRRRVGDVDKHEKTNKVTAKDEEIESVEWKDIVSYDVVAAVPPKSPQTEKIPAKAVNEGEVKKKQVIKAKKPNGKSKIEQKDDVKEPKESLNKKLIKSVRSKLTGKVSTEPQITMQVASPSRKKPSNVPMPARNGIDQRREDGKRGKSVKPPRPKKATPLSVEKETTDQEKVQERASTDGKEEQTLHALDQEGYAFVESSRPVPVYRKAKSMNVGSRSTRLALVRQASKNLASLKLRSSSSKAPDLPSEGDNPVRLRFRRGRVAGEGSSSSGIQLRIRSLRRRGVGVAGATNTSFGVPVVTLRHQKTLEKKKSQRLHNILIEETASKLVKTRKSRVKALVGAFETLISKISN